MSSLSHSPRSTPQSSAAHSRRSSMPQSSRSHSSYPDSSPEREHQPSVTPTTTTPEAGDQPTPATTARRTSVSVSPSNSSDDDRDTAAAGDEADSPQPVPHLDGDDETQQRHEIRPMDTLEDIVKYLNARGDAMGAIGEFVEADESLRAAHKRLTEAEENAISDEIHRELLIMTLNNLGVLYRRKKNDAQALQYLECVRRLEEDSVEGVSPLTLINLASVAGGLNLVDDSISYAESARRALFKRFPTIGDLNANATPHDCLLFSASWFHLARGAHNKMIKERTDSKRSGLQVLLLYKKALQCNRSLSSGGVRTAEMQFMLDEYAAAREQLKKYIGARLSKEDAIIDPPAFPGDMSCCDPQADPMMDVLVAKVEIKKKKKDGDRLPDIHGGNQKSKKSREHRGDDQNASEAEAADERSVAEESEQEESLKRSAELTKKLTQNRRQRKENQRSRNAKLGGTQAQKANKIYGVSNLKEVTKHSPNKEQIMKNRKKLAAERTKKAKSGKGSAVGEEEQPKKKERRRSSSLHSMGSSTSAVSSISETTTTQGTPATNQLPPIAAAPPPRATKQPQHHQRERVIVKPAPMPPQQQQNHAASARHRPAGGSSKLPPINNSNRPAPPQGHQNASYARRSGGGPGPVPPQEQRLSEASRRQQLDLRLPPILFVHPQMFGLQVLFDAAQQTEKEVTALNCIYQMHRETEVLFPRFTLRTTAKQPRGFFSAQPPRKRTATFLEPTESSQLHTKTKSLRSLKKSEETTEEEEKKKQELLQKRIHSRVRRMRVMTQTAEVLEKKNLAFTSRAYYNKWSQLLRTRHEAKRRVNAVVVLQHANEKVLIASFFQPWLRGFQRQKKEREEQQLKQEEERLAKERAEVEEERKKLESERESLHSNGGGGASSNPTPLSTPNQKKRSMRRRPVEEDKNVQPIEDTLFDEATKVTNAWLEIDAEDRTEDEKRDFIEKLNVQKESFVETMSKYLQSEDGQSQIELFSTNDPSDAVIEREENIMSKLAPLFTLAIEESSLYSEQNDKMLIFMIKELQTFANFSEIAEDNSLFATVAAEGSVTMLKMLLENGITIPARSSALDDTLATIITLGTKTKYAMVEVLLEFSESLPIAKQKKQLALQWRELADGLVPSERGFSLLGEEISPANTRLLTLFANTEGIGLDLEFEYSDGGDGQTLLTRTCGNGDWAGFKLLFDHLSTDLDAKNRILSKVLGNGTTALLESVVGGNAEIVKELCLNTSIREKMNIVLTLNDDLMGLNDKHTWTPFSYAMNELTLYQQTQAISSPESINKMHSIATVLHEFGGKDEHGERPEEVRPLGGKEDDEEAATKDASPMGSPGAESLRLDDDNSDADESNKSEQHNEDQHAENNAADDASSPQSSNLSTRKDDDEEQEDLNLMESATNPFDTPQESDLGTMSMEKVGSASRERDDTADGDEHSKERENNAATKIQTIQRQRMANKELQRRREAAAVKKQDLAAAAEEERREDDAATKIQAIQRKRMAKKELDRRRKEAQEKSQAAGTTDDDQDQQKREDQAATKIQAIQRKRMAQKELERRREVAKAKKEALAASAEEERREDDAATKIQAIQRRRMAKKELDRRREEAMEKKDDEDTDATVTQSATEQAAAIKIQSLQRQRLARREVARRRALKERDEQNAKVVANDEIQPDTATAETDDTDDTQPEEAPQPHEGFPVPSGSLVQGLGDALPVGAYPALQGVLAEPAVKEDAPEAAEVPDAVAETDDTDDTQPEEAPQPHEGFPVPSGSLVQGLGDALPVGAYPALQGVLAEPAEKILAPTPPPGRPPRSPPPHRASNNATPTTPATNGSRRSSTQRAQENWNRAARKIQTIIRRRLAKKRFLKKKRDKEKALEARVRAEQEEYKAAMSKVEDSLTTNDDRRRENERDRAALKIQCAQRRRRARSEVRRRRNERAKKNTDRVAAEVLTDRQLESGAHLNANDPNEEVEAVSGGYSENGSFASSHPGEDLADDDSTQPQQRNEAGAEVPTAIVTTGSASTSSATTPSVSIKGRSSWFKRHDEEHARAQEQNDTALLTVKQSTARSNSNGDDASSAVSATSSARSARMRLLELFSGESAGSPTSSQSNPYPAMTFMLQALEDDISTNSGAVNHHGLSNHHLHLLGEANSAVSATSSASVGSALMRLLELSPETASQANAYPAITLMARALAEHSSSGSLGGGDIASSVE